MSQNDDTTRLRRTGDGGCRAVCWTAVGGQLRIAVNNPSVRRLSRKEEEEEGEGDYHQQFLPSPSFYSSLLSFPF